MKILDNLFKKEDKIVTDLSILQQVSRKTSFEECDKIDLFNRLYTLMKSGKLWTSGFGLAAIQIGIDLSAFYYELNDKIIQIVNPVIIEQNERFIAKSEGCLSFPNQRVDTYRYKNLIIEADIRKIDKKTQQIETNKVFLNSIKRNQRFSVDDLEAHILSHEIDHVIGKTIFDNAATVMQSKRVFPKIGRNDPCFCGSNRKLKKCCIDIYEAQQNARIIESKE